MYFILQFDGQIDNHQGMTALKLIWFVFITCVEFPQCTVVALCCLFLVSEFRWHLALRVFILF